MGKDSKETYGAEGKFAGVLKRPETIMIVGLDVPVSTCEELADPDRLDLERDPGFAPLVESVYRHGIRTPVTVRKIGEHVLAVDGRRRIRAAREANARLEKEGEERRVLCPCIPDKADGLEGSLDTLVIANEHRREDSVVARARKAQRLREAKRPEDEIAAQLGVSKMTLSNWRALLQVEPKLLARVESGKIPVAVGYQLGKLPADKQAEALDQLLEEAGGDPKALKGQKGRAAATKKAKGESVRAPSTKLRAGDLANLYGRLESTEEEPHEDANQELAFALLAVIMGDDTTGKGLREFPSVHKVVRQVLKDARAE